MPGGPGADRLLRMPRGHSLSIYARFSGKKRTSLYISREKGDHCYLNKAQRSFLLITIFYLGELYKKLARKVHVNTERVYRIMLMPPWASHNTP